MIFSVIRNNAQASVAGDDTVGTKKDDPDDVFGSATLSENRANHTQVIGKNFASLVRKKG